MIDNRLISQLAAIASAKAPEEICGFLVPCDDTDLPRIVLCENEAEHKNSAFKIGHAQAAPYLDRDDVILFHSHPSGPAYPSFQDMKMAQQAGLQMLILAFDEEDALDYFTFGPPQKLDLKTRIYRHGVTDCYGLVRDYYAAEKQIILDDVPRQWGWWDEGGDLYRAHFRDFGFRQLDTDEPRRLGDVFVASLRASVPNHAGIYIGSGLILHHPAGRLAVDKTRLVRSEALLRYEPFINFWLRYEAQEKG